MTRPAALAVPLALLLAAAAHAAPRAVRVVVDGPSDSKPTATALHALLAGLGAVQAAGAVEVGLSFGEHRGAPSAQMSAWLTDAARWGKGEHKSRRVTAVTEADEGRSADGHLVIITPQPLDAAALGALAGRRVTLLTDGPTPPACAGDPRAACHTAPLSADPLGAAAVAVERALGAGSGVWITTADATLTVPLATRHLTVIVPGAAAPTSAALGAGRPLVEGGSEVVAATVWTLPPAGAHPVVLPKGVSRALVVGVGARVVVDECALADGDAARWRFDGPGPGWSPALGERLRFAVSGVDALVAPAGPGRVEIPASVVGAYTLTPLWVEGEARRPIGEPVSCVAAARLRPRVTLSARAEDGEVVVAATFTGADERPLAAKDVLDAGPVEARLAGAVARLVPAGEAAEARLPLPPAGAHTLAVSAPASRALDLTGAELTVQVGHAGVGGGGAWWPGIAAAALVGLGFLGGPALIGGLRRRRPAPRGTLSIAVGGSPVMDRRLGPQTAWPALLVGVRDIPIADGEALARVEARYVGLRPMVVATVLGKPDAAGRCAVREERCPLEEARPFVFSNVRVEFVEEG
ncbi:MAG: hypothetical protein H6705_13085 [Myxococcales bacterium]|nr:hypothetical protein [Myxococcales bacterium]